MAKGYNKNVLKQADLFKVGDLLRLHCRAEEGFAVYETGWDDEMIMELVQEKYPDLSISLYNVAGLRKSLMGPLRQPEKLTLESLLTRIKDLEAWAAARPVQGFKKGEKS